MNLEKGNKIAIISTARKVSLEELEYAKTVLESWELKPIEAPNLRAEYHQFCGTDKQRTQDLQWALDDEEIKAIICFRGGYGTVRILDNINLENFTKKPKWIVGYSDVTALHNFINAKTQTPTLHATMPVNFKENTKEALSSLKNALFGKPYQIKTTYHSKNKLGTVKGKIVGGNLSMLYSLSGTKFDIDTNGKILFIEDLDEYLYHIDRMMWNLKLSGKLENLKALIVGGMTSMHDNTIPFGKNALEIILEATKDYNYPICFDFPAGHLDDNQALILNRECKLVIGKEGTTINF